MQINGYTTVGWCRWLAITRFMRQREVEESIMWTQQARHCQRCSSAHGEGGRFISYAWLMVAALQIGPSGHSTLSPLSHRYTRAFKAIETDTFSWWVGGRGCNGWPPPPGWLCWKLLYRDGRIINSLNHLLAFPFSWFDSGLVCIHAVCVFFSFFLFSIISVSGVIPLAGLIISIADRKHWYAC